MPVQVRGGAELGVQEKLHQRRPPPFPSPFPSPSAWTADRKQHRDGPVRPVPHMYLEQPDSMARWPEPQNCVRAIDAGSPRADSDSGRCACACAPVVRWLMPSPMGAEIERVVASPHDVARLLVLGMEGAPPEAPLFARFYVGPHAQISFLSRRRWNERTCAGAMRPGTVSPSAWTEPEGGRRRPTAHLQRAAAQGTWTAFFSAVAVLTQATCGAQSATRSTAASAACARTSRPTILKPTRQPGPSLGSPSSSSSCKHPAQSASRAGRRPLPHCRLQARRARCDRVPPPCPAEFMA